MKHLSATCHRPLIHAVILFLFIGATVSLCYSKATHSKKRKVIRHTKLQKQFLPPDEPAEAEDFYLKKRLAPGQTQLPIDRYTKARQEARQLKRYSSALGRFVSEKDGFSSAELDGVGNWMQLGPGNIGGRTRALVFAPTNPNLMYAAGVAGGVWKSTNAGASWAAIGDLLPNLAICTLAVDPVNANTVYAGTGEVYFNSDAQRGAGIFKTTDGGTTWGQIASPSDDPGFYYVNKIVISPNNNQRLYAGTATALYRSSDGGVTWTDILRPTVFRGCLDLAIRTDKPTDYLMASFGTFDHVLMVYTTDASGSTGWSSSTLPDFFGVGRTSIAIAPSNQNIVYALASEYFDPIVDPTPPGPFQYGLHAVFRSTDFGATWGTQVRNTSPVKLNRLLLSNPIIDNLVECGQGSSDFLLNQGWYDNAIAVDPLDPNKVWAGGIDLFRSDDGGVNWGLASYWWANTTDPHYVHADQHVIAFHPQYNGSTNRTMFVANDGGIFRTDNARAAVATGTTAACTPSNTSVTWTPLNTGYGVTQFYYGLPYPDDTSYFGGTQDNGTVRGTDVTGINSWSSILGGDGGAVAIDRNNINVLYAENTGLSIQKSTNGGTKFNPAVNGISESPNNFLFISPFAMDPSNSQRLWAGGMQLWRTNNGAGTWVRATSDEFTFSPYSAIAVSASDPNYVAAGSSDGFVVTTKMGLTADSSSPFFWLPRFLRGNSYVSSVAYDPLHTDVVYATVSTFKVQNTDYHVYRSTDAGSTWRGLDGVAPNNLPDIPVHSIVVDPTATNRLYVGTDIGVFVSLDWGQTWARENSGFSDVNTESLSFNSFAGSWSLYAFTHGRGAWRVRIQSPCATINPAQKSFTSNGGLGTIGITAPASCNWSAMTNDSWITITSGANGTGNGTVSYTVSGNSSGSQPTARVGTIFVADQLFLVKQDGNNCLVFTNPESQYLSSSAGTASAQGNANSVCTLSAVSNDSWINITSPPTGTNGFIQVNYSYSANLLNSIRSGSISISSPFSTTKLNIRQAGPGCTYAVNPESITVDNGLNNLSIAVTATTGCQWSAVSQDNWITITSGASGSGNGTVNYSVMPNHSPDSRFGHIVVAGHEVGIFQQDGVCVDFSVAPTVFNFGQNGGQGVATITTAGNCQWGATTNTNFIFITSPTTVGPGKLTFNVAANTLGVPRTGTITLPFNTVTINQDGSSCFMTLSPSASFMPTTGGTNTISIQVPAGCNWTATKDSPWITINSGGSGTGNGILSYSVAANTTSQERVGSLTINGINFRITQSGCGFTISPNGVSVNANLSTRTINITAPGGCSWDAQTTDSWIQIFSGQTGTGNGTVVFTAFGNTGPARTGTISVAGQLFTVQQQAGPPTAIHLESFYARARANHVLLEWKTGLEVENLGFRIYRDDGAGRSCITPRLIAGGALRSGSSVTASGHYSWNDNVPMSGKESVYWLEDIALDGSSKLHGPFSAIRTTEALPLTAQSLGLDQPNTKVSASHQIETVAQVAASTSATSRQWRAQMSLASGRSIKISVRQSGWYRITQPELVGAGLDAGIDPRNLQLFVDGVELPVFVSGQEDRRFDAEDCLEFYGVALDTPSTNTRVFWLVSGSRPGLRITRTRASKTIGGNGDFPYTTERRDHSTYFAALRNGDEENFFGDIITSERLEQKLTVTNLALNSNSAALIEISLQGVTALPHRVSVDLNGSAIGNLSFEQQARGFLRLKVPLDSLRQGENVVTLQSTGPAGDITLVDSIKLTYPHTFRADNDRLVFNSPGLRGVTISGFSSENIRVFDVTDERGVQELATRVQLTPDGYAVSIAATSVNHKYLAVTDITVLRAASLAPNRASQLHSPANAADFVIITDARFNAALKPLIDLRNKQGLHTALVDVDDIYDEFSFGQKSPQAIKDFLSFSRSKWTVSPRFVMLVGDSSYDPKDYLGGGDTDLVPTRLIDTSYLETATDDWFVDFDDDGRTEMNIGRLPARNGAEATALVSKIVDYESTRASMSSARKTVLLVSDRNDQFNFEEVAERLRGSIPQSVAVAEVFRGRFDEVSARAALIDAINSGPFLVNYVGHGSANGWQSLLSDNDIGSLTNGASPAFFVSMTCLNGYFHDPANESLAEGLLRADGRGAIAVWASSGLTEPRQQAEMNRRLFERLFGPEQMLTLGEIVSRTKAEINDTDVRRTWLLFGDPTMRLR